MPIKDGDWELFNYDPDTGVSVWRYDHPDGRITYRRDIPIDDLTGHLAEERAASAGKPWGDGRVIGSVPDGIAWSSGYMQARMNGDTAWIKRFWNDRDNFKLRTFEGRV